MIPLPKAKMFVGLQNDRTELPAGAVQMMNMGQDGFVTGHQVVRRGSFEQTVEQTGDHDAPKPMRGIFDLDFHLHVGGQLDLDRLDSYMKFWFEGGVHPQAVDIETDLPVKSFWAAVAWMKMHRSKWPTGVYNVWGADNNGPFFQAVCKTADFVNVGLQDQLDRGRKDLAAGKPGVNSETHYVEREIIWARNVIAPSLPCIADIIPHGRSDEDILIETGVCKSLGAIPQLYWTQADSPELQRLVNLMLGAL